MTRIYLSICFFFFFSVVLIVQPTLTYENNAPLVGDIYYQSYSQDQLLPGPQGPNKTWDFSDINVFETGETMALEPSSTPFADIFTQANIAFNYNASAAYNYSEINQTEGLNWGIGFDDVPSMIIYYDDPAKLISYPFSYQDEFTDNYQGDYEYQQLYTRTTGILTKIADAWGTITTPAGTFENVLRLKTVRDHIDSVWMGDIFISKTVITYKDYEWYTSDSRLPVFSMTITNSLLLNDTVSYFLTGTTSTAKINYSTPGLNVSPNPATDQLNIFFTSEPTEDYKISLTNLLGNEVFGNTIIKPSDDVVKFSLNTAQFKPGLYLLSLTNGTDIQTTKVIIR